MTGYEFLLAQMFHHARLVTNPKNLITFLLYPDNYLATEILRDPSAVSVELKIHFSHNGKCKIVPAEFRYTSSNKNNSKESTLYFPVYP